MMEPEEKAPGYRTVPEIISQLTLTLNKARVEQERIERTLAYLQGNDLDECDKAETPPERPPFDEIYGLACAVEIEVDRIQRDVMSVREFFSLDGVAGGAATS